MTTIHKLLWSNESFFPNLIIFVKALFQYLRGSSGDSDERKISGRIICASDCSNICNAENLELDNLRALVKSPSFFLKFFGLLGFFWFAISWLPLKIFCYTTIVFLTSDLTTIKQYRNISEEDCYLLQGVLRIRGLRKETLECIREGLAKEDYNKHIKGMLIIALAECKGRVYLEEDIEHIFCLKEILGHIEDIEKEDPIHAISIYLEAADLFKRDPFFGDTVSHTLRLKAEELRNDIEPKCQMYKKNNIIF